MPMLIEHIDAIARKKQRDVLYLVFDTSKPIQEWEDDSDYADMAYEYDWKTDPKRQEVCQWLDDHQIPWRLCGPIASENLMESYRGQIYIDVPYDENDAQYRLVQSYLEYSDGRMRFPTVTFCYVPLEIAMKNAHHDEPGFWDKWAENF